jgi:hypothetical protein
MGEVIAPLSLPPSLFGGKRDRPTGPCSLAESHRLAELLQQFGVYPKQTRDQYAADAFAAAIFAGVAGRQHLCLN